MAQLLRQYRRDTGEASVDRLEDRLGLGGKRFTERILIAGKGIQLVLCMGDEVRLAGQDLSYTCLLYTSRHGRFRSVQSGLCKVLY